jgi:redox-sensitive bicupin YhaK (pirin superfamily)
VGDVHGTEPVTSQASVEVTESRNAMVGPLHVQRVLPTRGRRSVGSWCFADHMGPLALSPEQSVDVAPHPHIGLQTVTWLFSGEFVHRDSLGSEQLIRPGQLNLMSAGHGVAHSEENPGLTYGHLHGVQLWVAQPEATRHGAAHFEHLVELPRVELDNCTLTLMMGYYDHFTSSARRDRDDSAVELDLRGGATTIATRSDYEYAVIVASGTVAIGSTLVTTGQLGYVGVGHDELRLDAAGPAKALLIGGVPLDEPLFMWWNFVARSKDEITSAWQAWATGDERFAHVASTFERIEVSPLVWFVPNS